MRRYETNNEDEKAENLKQLEAILAKTAFYQRVQYRPLLELISGTASNH